MGKILKPAESLDIAELFLKNYARAYRTDQSTLTGNAELAPERTLYVRNRYHCIIR